MYEVKKFDKRNAKFMLSQLKTAFLKKKLQIMPSVNLTNEINTYPFVLYTAVYNLVKNSDDAKAKNVEVIFSDYAGDILNPVYESLDVPKEGNFMMVRVHDNGKGFPKDRPLSEFLELGVSAKAYGSIGFGLYFVKLACKALRCHLQIESKPGDTNVTIYHPLNLS